MEAYLLAMLATVAFILSRRHQAMARVGLTIFFNWALCTGFVVMAKIYDAWYWFFLVDVASAYVILKQPAGRTQALIGACYILQLTFHIAYYFVGNGQAAYTYWQMLTAVAWLQISLLFIWGAGDAGKDLRRRNVRHDNRLAETADHPRMGRQP